MSEYSYEYEYDSFYCYPGSTVLINKLDIRDNELLFETERNLTGFNMLHIKNEPVKGSFDLKHLQNIHKAIFSDIFEWAGKLRTVDIAKGNQFCLCQHLEAYADSVFGKLKAEEYLTGKTLHEMPACLTYYLSEINVLHPFREGNGRTQRLFIEYLARYAGFHIDFSKVDSKEMIEASALSFACEYDRMNEMFKRILSPISIQEKESFIRSITPNISSRER